MALSGGHRLLQAEVPAKLCLPLDTPASCIHPRLCLPPNTPASHIRPRLGFHLDFSSDLHLTIAVPVLCSWRKSRSQWGDSCADSSFSSSDRQSMDKSQRVECCREENVMAPHNLAQTKPNQTKLQRNPKRWGRQEPAEVSE